MLDFYVQNVFLVKTAHTQKTNTFMTWCFFFSSFSFLIAIESPLESLLNQPVLTTHAHTHTHRKNRIKCLNWDKTKKLISEVSRRTHYPTHTHTHLNPMTFVLWFQLRILRRWSEVKPFSFPAATTDLISLDQWVTLCFLFWRLLISHTWCEIWLVYSSFLGVCVCVCVWSSSSTFPCFVFAKWLVSLNEKKTIKLFCSIFMRKSHFSSHLLFECRCVCISVFLSLV